MNKSNIEDILIAYAETERAIRWWEKIMLEE